MLVSNSYQMRELELNVESGESDTLLTTAESVPVNMDDASW